MTDDHYPILSRYKYKLYAPEGIRLVPSDAYRIYAWMLSHVDEEFAMMFHEDGETPISQYLYFDSREKCCYWTVSLLTESTNKCFSQLLTDEFEIQLNPETIKAILVESQMYNSGEEFVLNCRSKNNNSFYTLLDVQSTLSFKKAGHYLIFPQEQLIVHSLAVKWNHTFPEYPIDDDDAINAICDGISISDYSLHTNKFHLKGNHIPGCVGKIQIHTKLSAPLMEIWNILICFSEFSGLGIKTTLGMGGIENHLSGIKGQKDLSADKTSSQ